MSRFIRRLRIIKKRRIMSDGFKSERFRGLLFKIDKGIKPCVKFVYIGYHAFSIRLVMHTDADKDFRNRLAVALCFS